MQLEVELSKAERQDVALLLCRRAGACYRLLRWLLGLVAAGWPAWLLLRHVGNAPLSLILTQVATFPAFWVALACEVLLLPPFVNAHLYRRATATGLLPRQNRPLLYTIGPEGVAEYCGGRRTASYAYGAFTNVYRARGLLVGYSGKRLLLALPLRCFATPADSVQTETTMLNGMMQARAALAPTLDMPEEECLWRFTYPFEGGQAVSAGRALRKARSRLFFKRPAFWAALAALGLFGLCAWLVLPTLQQAFYGLLRFSTAPLGTAVPYTCLLLSCFVLIFLPGAEAPPRDGHIPPLFGGACTLEVAEGGLRFFNQRAELTFPWEEVSRLARGEDAALVLRGSALLLPIPGDAAAPEELAPALAYIEAKTAG